jgi:hypothetical protein
MCSKRRNVLNADTGFCNTVKTNCNHYGDTCFCDVDFDALFADADRETVDNDIDPDVDGPEHRQTVPSKKLSASSDDALGSLLQTLKRNCECGRARPSCADALAGEHQRQALSRRMEFFANTTTVVAHNRIYGELSGFYNNPNGKQKGVWEYR